MSVGYTKADLQDVELYFAIAALHAEFSQIIENCYQFARLHNIPPPVIPSCFTNFLIAFFDQNFA